MEIEALQEYVVRWVFVRDDDIMRDSGVVDIVL